MGDHLLDISFSNLKHIWSFNFDFSCWVLNITPKFHKLAILVSAHEIDVVVECFAVCVLDELWLEEGTDGFGKMEEGA